MRCARSHAAEFGIDAGRVGFMGFSAGGRVAVGVAHTNDPGARPDFVAPIYASIRDADLVSPPAGSGPMFLVAEVQMAVGLQRDVRAAVIAGAGPMRVVNRPTAAE